MSSGKKKGLGRGLSALFGDEKPKEENLFKKELNMVSIGDLSRNPYQPRQFFNESKLGVNKFNKKKWNNSAYCS